MAYQKKSNMEGEIEIISCADRVDAIQRMDDLTFTSVLVYRGGMRKSLILNLTKPYIIGKIKKMIKWYTIPGFTYYEINKRGQVRHRRHKRILKRGIPKNGYAQVHVRSDTRNKQVSKCIHHLMAITFMKDKPLGHEIAFKDGDKTKIELTNLEYRLPENNKNRIRKTLTYCLLCGRVNPRANKKYCSRRHQFLYNHTLLQCCYCNNKFYRKNSSIRRNNSSPKYTSGNVYCTGKCFHLSRRAKSK